MMSGHRKWCAFHDPYSTTIPTLPFQERRQEEYERSVQQQMDLLGQKRMEHQEELLKESQLHRRLLQQRRDQKSQRRWQLAADVVTFCLDMAVLTVDYKNKSGDKEVPALLQNDWRELFLRGESLSGGGEPAELSATSAPGERQQALLQQHDLDDYLAVSGRWIIPGASGKKRSPSAQARDDMALRVESAVVTGFVVHRLLRLVYPPKPSVQAPERPTFTLMGVVMGKSYAGKTHCLQWVQSSLDVRHIVMHDLVKRSLATLEQETRMELEAAGSWCDGDAANSRHPRT
ncbi:Sperm flagellar protein 2 [Amphibalanus amphitrite]|uniref:Sperm flagellar protein 2 n=1 Tax=Amphibalanus amphitrite TaxID=1232801 RepID=A0A6A4VGC0_AMPAM|nr:Sperm flagellar protein 2 [Amphibalanus amphitrite]